MSGRKNITREVRIVTDGDMSGSISSPAVDVRHLDDCAFQLVWTGTPTGTFSVESTVDGSTWQALDFGSSIAASGAAGSHLLNLNLVPFAQLRCVYMFGSGSGTLQVWFMAKEI